MPARALSRDRIIVLLALLGVTALAWLYLIVAHQSMTDMTNSPGDMGGMAMPPGATAMTAPWVASEFALTFVMWWVMMLGMMLPSAAPTILTVATLARRRREGGQNGVPASAFTIGYLLAWGAFCVAATVLQWGLDRAALLSPMLETKSAAIGGALFILCGLYQFTPFKYACLRQCRSPFAFLLNHWRDGWQGALRMGWGHGLYCLGCCWVLMALLFAVGVMNLAWVAAIAALIFAEKLFPHGLWIGRLAGVLMLAFGAHLLWRS
jgi:predicted metal-binding membrane protein